MRIEKEDDYFVIIRGKLNCQRFSFFVDGHSSSWTSARFGYRKFSSLVDAEESLAELKSRAKPNASRGAK